MRIKWIGESILKYQKDYTFQLDVSFTFRNAV